MRANVYHAGLNKSQMLNRLPWRALHIRNLKILVHASRIFFAIFPFIIMEGLHVLAVIVRARVGTDHRGEFIVNKMTLTHRFAKGLHLFFVATLLAGLAIMAAPCRVAQAQDPVDAVFANWGQTNRFCAGDGAGGFACSDVSTDTKCSDGVALGDVNGDGNLDAVFANWQRNRYCAGDGAGGFACSDVSTDTNDSRGVALGDLNGDGNLDAVFANDFDRNRLCAGDGAGASPVAMSAGTKGLARASPWGT